SSLFQYAVPSIAIRCGHRDGLACEGYDRTAAVSRGQVCVQLHESNPVLFECRGDNCADDPLVQHLLPLILVEVRKGIAQGRNPCAWQGKGRSGWNVTGSMLSAFQ